MFFSEQFHQNPLLDTIEKIYNFLHLSRLLQLSEEDTEALFSTALILAMFTNKSMPYTRYGLNWGRDFQ